jgi:hypothetical protein
VIDTLAIPDSIAAIDAEWLTDALSTTHPGLEVRSAEVLDSLGQGGCTKLRVALHTNRPGFPPTVIVKGCLEPQTEHMKKIQRNEVRYYEQVVPGLGVETVEILFSHADENNGILVMEDLALRGVMCLNALDPITDFRLAADFLGEIARIHARWWEAPELAEGDALGWVPGPGPSTYVVGKLQDHAEFAEKMTLPRAVAVPRLLKDPDRLLAALLEVSGNPLNLPFTITHSGLFLQNLYVTAEYRPGFLDWNMYRTTWAKDVTTFIVCCLDTLDRRRWEAALLQHYLTALEACGVAAPDFDLAWRAYRGWPVHYAVVWLTNRTDWHSEEACTAIAGRCTQAMVDLDTFGVLGV